MAIVFSELVKHGTFQFAPGVAYGFEDPDAEPYFVACGWASVTTDPAVVTVTLGEIDIDPETVMHKDGQTLVVQDVVSKITEEPRG